MRTLYVFLLSIALLGCVAKRQTTKEYLTINAQKAYLQDTARHVWQVERIYQYSPEGAVVRVEEKEYHQETRAVVQVTDTFFIYRERETQTTSKPDSTIAQEVKETAQAGARTAWAVL